MTEVSHKPMKPEEVTRPAVKFKKIRFKQKKISKKGASLEAFKNFHTIAKIGKSIQNVPFPYINEVQVSSSFRKFFVTLDCPM